MTQPPIRPEEIADLLTGRLSQDQREDLVSRLARSRDGREVLIDAAALFSEAESDEEPRSLSDTGARPRRLRFRGWWAPALAIAAVVAIVIVRSPSSNSAFDPRYALAGTGGRGSMSRLFGADWEQTLWSGTRGNDDGLSDQSRAVRLGVRTAQLLRAGALHDTSAVLSVTEPLAQLALAVPTGSAVASLLRADSSAVAFADSRRTDGLLSALRALSQPSGWFDLGLWLESTRQVTRAGVLSDDVAHDATERLDPIITDLSRPGDVDDARHQRLRRLLDEIRLQLETNTWTSRTRIALDSAIAEAGR